MKGFIDNIDFVELEMMRYYAPPASWSQEKKQANVKNKIFNGDWIGACKKDGYFAQLIKDEDGNRFLLSRSRNVNGEFPNKVEWVPQLNTLFEFLPNGTCLLGELYLPSKPGSKNVTSILGCLKEKAIKRQEEGEKLHFYIFDVLAWNGKSYIDTIALERFQLIDDLRENYIMSYVEFAVYFEGDVLWSQLGELLENGEEGIVMTHETCKYQPGKRPSKETLKVKKEISNTIDCFFTGRGTSPTKEYSGKEIEEWKYWVNSIDDERLDEGEHYFDYTRGAAIIPVTKPYYYKWCGSLEIGLVKDDKVVPIGMLSGLTDEIKSNPEKYKGRVIEVSAMEIGTDDNGEFSGLRHARMINFRDDKKWDECSWNQLM